MPKSYRIQLVCSHMDHAEWVVMENLYLSLNGAANTYWEFNCPVHGAQRQKALQVEEKRAVLHETVECAIEGCRQRTVGVLQGRAFCREHFLAICQKRLDAYRTRFDEQQWGDVSLESVSRFMQDAMTEADRLDLDKVERARLLGIIFSAADLGKRLRRSPRKLMALPVRLVDHNPLGGWEEDTETLLVSRCGALLLTEHSAKIGDELEVMRLDRMSQARARVAWSPASRRGNPLLAVEFLDAENFWGLDWAAIEREIGPMGDHWPLAN